MFFEVQALILLHDVYSSLDERIKTDLDHVCKISNCRVSFKMLLSMDLAIANEEL